MAKLFGYANTASASTPETAPALAEVVYKVVEAAKDEPKSEKAAAPVVVKAPIRRRSKIKLIQSIRKDSGFREEVQSPPKARDPPTQLTIDTKIELVSPAKSEQPTSKVVEKARVGKVGKPSISSLDDIMNLLENEAFTSSPVEMKRDWEPASTRKGTGRLVNAGKPSLSSLDGMMSVLENESFVSSQQRKPLDNEKKIAVRGSIGKGSPQKLKAGNQSLGSLDEMMSLLEQDWNVGSPDRKASVAARKFGRPQDFAEPTIEVEKSSVSVPASTPAYHDDLVTSPVSFTSLQSNPFMDKPFNPPAQVDEETESTEKPLLEYMKEAEEMRLEREQMELERQRILEEERAFQEEADRFAQEKDQMRRFVENLKIEEERDFENQERKRRIAEEQRRKAEAESKRLQELEAERLAVEVAERLNKENERMEMERRERKARLFQERVDMERARYIEEEARLKAQRMEDDLTAREAEAREKLLRFAEEKARFEAQRLEDEGIAEQQRLEEERRIEREIYMNEEGLRSEERERADRERYDEQAMRNYWRAARENAERSRQERAEAQRRADENLQTKRIEDDRIERLRYAEDDVSEPDEPEVLTKEQEMAKAEEKLRAAFLGLAQERDQISNGVNPAGGLRSDKGGREVGRQKRQVSRYNTVGAGARPRQEQPLGVSRVNTVANKGVGGGLPSGPKAGGFGLPGRPNAGLPSGPRPRGKA
jgi:hypothetical protein